MSLIECKNLSLGYDNYKVVEKLNFNVESGDYLCIVGKNGSGKSTLIKTLLGLQSPIEGHITIGDGLKQNEIGYLPQQTVIQKDFPASVREIVLSGCLNNMSFHPFYSKKEKTLAEANMEKMKITDLAKRCYRELSGGQQQRVLLARALCATKKLLILDEPVAGLDPDATKDMYYLINKLNKDEHITIIMVSHDIKEALKYASKILQMENVCLFFGKTEDYLQSEIGKSFYNYKGED